MAIQWVASAEVGRNRHYVLEVDGEPRFGTRWETMSPGKPWGLYAQVPADHPADFYMPSAGRLRMHAVRIGKFPSAEAARAQATVLLGSPALLAEKIARRRGELAEIARIHTNNAAAKTLTGEQLERIAALVRQQNAPEWDDIRAVLAKVAR